jgi:hypothetical protein
MSKLDIELLPPLWFTYGQFLVYDKTAESLRGPWIEECDKFFRADSVVSFMTILELGTASVFIRLGKFEASDQYQRAISVPFHAKSREVVIQGPEEDWNLGRTISVEPGSYRLTAAQYVIDDDHEGITIAFERLLEPLERSEILVCLDDQE